MLIADIDIGNSIQQTLDEFFAFLPNLLGALVIFIVGYIIAKVVAALVRRGARAVGTDRALATGTAGEYKERLAPRLQASDVLATLVFWLIFALTIMLAVSALGIEALTNFIESVVGYLPNVIAALLILLAAIAIAGVLGVLRIYQFST